jgi:hypothetical protein
MTIMIDLTKLLLTPVKSSEKKSATGKLRNQNKKTLQRPKEDDDGDDDDDDEEEEDEEKKQ